MVKVVEVKPSYNS